MPAPGGAAPSRPHQLALADAGLVEHVYACSFILTNLDVSAPELLAETEHWYRHRTDIEALNNDVEHGAALRHLGGLNPGVQALSFLPVLAGEKGVPFRRGDAAELEERAGVLDR